MKADFDTALQQHFAAISHRDLEAFESHLTRGEKLVYVFQLQAGEWRIIHDQNTAFDYTAFARANGIEM